MPGTYGGGDDDDEEFEEGAVERRLTFWADGFSIEGGEFYKYDAPGAQELLTAIRNGRAPASLWSVRFDQPVKVVVEERTHEPYSPPPKAPVAAFSGSGNRLGSAVPEIAGAGTVSSAPQQAAPAAAATPSAELKVDESKPATTVQVRLGDGTRLVPYPAKTNNRLKARVNLDQTVGDIRGFVRA